MVVYSLVNSTPYIFEWYIEGKFLSIDYIVENLYSGIGLCSEI